MKYLLEAMGSGVAMFDYDNDGRMDLFFANSAALKDPMPANELPNKRDRAILEPPIPSERRWYIRRCY
jgi:hypothetical protein